MDILKVNHIDDSSQTIPIQQSNATGMQNLPEDCLLGIFLNDSLTLMELVALAETCKRFKLIVQRVFPKAFGIKEEDCSSRYRVTCKHKLDTIHNVEDIERILNNFGSNLSTLTIHDSNEIVVNSITKNCGRIKLEHLEMGYFVAIEPLVRWKAIFQHVNKITISDCHFMEDSASFKLQCDSLVELDIVLSSSCEIILRQHFPELKRLAFRNSKVARGTDDQTAMLFDFIARHQLKSLHLESSDSVFGSDFIHKINDSCKELENLKLDQFETDDITVDVSGLQNLAKIKILDIGPFYDDWSPLVPFLRELKSLEMLIMYRWHPIDPLLLDVLSQLPNFRELCLNECEYTRGIPSTKFVVRWRPE